MNLSALIDAGSKGSRRRRRVKYDARGFSAHSELRKEGLTNAAMEKRKKRQYPAALLPPSCFPPHAAPLFYRITVFSPSLPCLFVPCRPLNPQPPYKTRNLPFYFSLSSSRVFSCERGHSPQPPTYSTLLVYPHTIPIPLTTLLHYSAGYTTTRRRNKNLRISPHQFLFSVRALSAVAAVECNFPRAVLYLLY